jgi:hypothetical protein
MRRFCVDSLLSRSRMLGPLASGLVFSLALVACQGSSSSNTTAGAAAPIAVTKVNQAAAPVNSTPRSPAPRGTFVPGGTPPAGQPGPGGPRGMGGMGFNVLDAAAKALNLSTPDLMTQLQSGKTVADIAKEKGVDETALKNTLLNAAKAGIDTAVSNGQLTQQEGDQIKSQLAQMDLNSLFQRSMGQGGNGIPGTPLQGQQPPMAPVSPSN